MPFPNPFGRPHMFQSVDELEQRIKDYFDSCWEHHHVAIKDKDSGNILQWVPQFDQNGQPLMKLKERPTITGLALALGTNRKTLLEYENRNNEFSDLIRAAKTLVEYYYEKGTAEGDVHPAMGIFALKNFEWTDVLQIKANTTPETLNPMDIKQQLEQRKNIKEINGNSLTLIGNAE